MPPEAKLITLDILSFGYGLSRIKNPAIFLYLLLELVFFMLHTLSRGNIKGFSCRKEAAMCKGLCIALALIWLIYTPASLCAQNAPANLYFRNNPFQEDLVNPLAHFIMSTEVKSYSPAIEYEELNPLLGKQSRISIKDEELMYECWMDMKSQLPKPAQTQIKNLKITTVNRNIFNALYNKRKVDEKKRLRLAWKEAFKVDVWYPYYKVKEAEDWIKEKFSVRIFKFKGKPKFENDQILYVFKATF